MTMMLNLCSKIYENIFHPSNPLIPLLSLR